MTDLFRNPNNAAAGPVECLGLTFPDDNARRAHFLAILREKLRDPAFRRIDGFPIGSDEDILALSDPPYYTACPNPFIEEFIRRYGTPYDPAAPYHKEPFAADVSEGKNDPIYNAHSYHTKVPHKAIMRYILHYTQPGDLVFDGFCGTGMTGVAAQLCGDRKVVESLGYRVEKDGAILEPVQEAGQTVWKPFSRLGARRAILNDLSPAATFIAYNYNTPVDVAAFEREAQRILAEVEAECGWMYETLHVEPASSRLKQLTGFTTPKLADLSVVEPASSRLNDQHAGLTGINKFTQRQDCLPHWQLPGSFYFLTFNTDHRRKLSPSSRQIVLDALLFFDGLRLKFIAAVVMPDHVHAVIQPLEKSSGIYWDLSDLMHSIKSYSANQINKIENTPNTKVWQTETYDRIIRNDREYAFVLQYIAYNPVQAGLSKKPGDYQWFALGTQVMEAGWKPAPQGKINYTVWSDVFICPECAGEVVFWDAAVDKDAGQVRDEFPCPHCAKQLTKRNMERAWITKFDTAIQQTIRQAKQTPVLINYSVGTKRFEKTPDAFDLALIEKIEGMEIPYWFPTGRMMEGGETRKNDPIGITHVHHFYTRRNLLSATCFTDRETSKRMLALLTGVTSDISKMARVKIGYYFKGGGGPFIPGLAGTLYIPSLSVEKRTLFALENRLSTFVRSLPNLAGFNAILGTGSATGIVSQSENSVDYLFLDPPFGANIMYSELNFLWESWLKVFTNNRPEAIENKVQGKTLNDYRRLMADCFKEAFRILKPGRWMTVEFSNTQASVWNAIQTAIQEAGFIVANVAALDKKQGSFKAVTTTTAVKQDLVISAYKPNGGLEERFAQTGGNEKSVWDFVSAHLQYLPVVKTVGPASSRPSQQDAGSTLLYIAERDPRILFDRMVAWFIRHNFPVPLSSPEFQAGLQERFPVRDGMIFLPEQLNDYDRARLHAAHAPQMELFVSDERSAIDWLTDFLKPRPATYQDLHPEFMRQLGAGWKKHEARPELKQLLEDNFLQDAQDRWYVPDPNKAQELEQLRTRALLKEFAVYQAHAGRQIKEFRTEALRAGFKAAYDHRDYRAIVGVAAKLPDAVLQEDEKLLMYYDVASMRLEEE